MRLKKYISHINSVLTFILIVTGSVPFKYKKVQSVGVSLCVIFSILLPHSTIKFVMSSSSVSIVSESLSVFMISYSTITMASIFILRRHVFIQAIERMNGEDDKFIEETNTRFLHLCKFLVGFMCFCQGPYLIIGFTSGLQPDVQLGTPESLYFPAYIPWNYDTPVKYTFALVYQALHLGYPWIICYGTMFVLAGLHAFSNVALDEILKATQNLLNIKKCFTIDEADCGDLVYEDLIRIIKRYQHYKKFLNEITAYVGNISSALLLFVLVCSVWNIASLVDNKDQTSVKTKNICLLIYLTVQLMIICYLGECIQEADHEIRHAIYNISWYTTTIKLRKTIIMFMLHTQIPTNVKAYHVIPVNVNLSVRTLNKMYAMLNLYRTSYTDKYSH